MALTICTTKRFGGKAWFHYDHTFRCEAEVNNLQDWSVMRTDLYNFHTSAIHRVSDAQVVSTYHSNSSFNKIGSSSDATGNASVLNYACLGMTTPVLPQGPTVNFAMPVTSRTAAHLTAEFTIIQLNGEKIAHTRTIKSTSGQHRDQENNNPVNCPGPFKILPIFESKFLNGGLANSPINVHNLEMQLLWNPDRQKVNYVVSSFREGFHIGFRPHAVKLKSAKSNCPSLMEHSVVIDNYLTTEIHAGRVSGPFKTPPFPTIQVSRFGIIPKKNKANA